MSASELVLTVEGKKTNGDPFRGTAVFAWVRGEFKCVEADDCVGFMRLTTAEETRKLLNKRQLRGSWVMRAAAERAAPPLFAERFKRLEVER